jgi:hypothetical protein
MAVSTEIYKESDGQALNVTLSYPTQGKAVAYVNGWLGITERSGNSGEQVGLSIGRVEYQFEVPSGLAVAIGEVVRIDLTALGSAHTPPSAAYNKSAASATNIDLFKATAAKDANNVVTGVLIANA